MSQPSTRQAADHRSDYFFFAPITTRWMDNDVYGHINNVTYYSYFDTVVNSYLIAQGGLDIHKGDTVGFVVNSGCSYFSPIAYPDNIEGALRINKLGNSSVEYAIAIFKQGSPTAVAQGHFVHVFVDRESNTPCPIPAQLRAALQKIQIK